MFLTKRHAGMRSALVLLAFTCLTGLVSVFGPFVTAPELELGYFGAGQLEQYGWLLLFGFGAVLVFTAIALLIWRCFRILGTTGVIIGALGLLANWSMLSVVDELRAAAPNPEWVSLIRAGWGSTIGLVASSGVVVCSVIVFVLKRSATSI